MAAIVSNQRKYTVFGERENMENQNTLLKGALLATCFISASLNAITGLIPEMANAFPDVPLSNIELITTIPSLFQMIGVLLGRPLAEKMGYKSVMMLGILLCTVGGAIPVVLPSLFVIILTRCIFGVGAGLTVSTILTLIVYFFSGSVRSTMIGFNGSASGLGATLSAFLAGKLLRFGWNKTFLVYGIGLPILILFSCVVPKVERIKEKEPEKDGAMQRNSHLPAGLWGLGFLMFLSLMLVTMYIVKVSTLITEAGFGTAEQGSTAVTFFSLGTFTAGLTYGKFRNKLGSVSLSVFYLFSMVGFLLGSLAQGLVMIWIGAFIVGYGYLGFMPFIQEEASRRYNAYGERATSLVLAFQSIGAFAAPYLSLCFGIISQNLNVQFMMCAVCFAILSSAGMLYARISQPD